MSKILTSFPSADGDILRFAEGITIEDFGVAPSNDQQCLLIYCQASLIAIVSAMGCDVHGFELAAGDKYSLTELLDQISFLTPSPASSA